MTQSVFARIYCLVFGVVAAGFASFACASGPMFPALLGASGYEFDFGDFNGDGLSDVISVLDTEHFAFIRYANTDGSFTDPIQIFVGGRCFDIVADDFNADGHLDFAVVYFLGSSVGVFLNQGNGTFASPKIIVLGMYLYPDLIESADINGDGLPEIFAAGYCLKNLGNGVFQQLSLNGFPFTNEQEFVDLNGDGLLDLVSVHREYDLLRYALNLGDFEFSDAVLLNDPDLEQMYSVGASDIDADGDVDIVSTGDKLRIWRNENGSFVGPEESDLYCGDILVQDLNGDQAADIIACSSEGWSSHTLGIGINDGTGTGFSQSDLWVGDGEGNLHLVDTTGDGLLDLWVHRERNIYQFAGLGQGEFQQHQYIEPVFSGSSAMADIDHDGDEDLVACAGSGIVVYHNNGNNEYELDNQYDVVSYLKEVMLVDLNGDQFLDIVTTKGARERHVYVLLNDQEGGFFPSTEYYGVSEMSDLVAGDIDGDLDTDLLALSSEHPCRILRNAGDGTFESPVTLHPHSSGGSVSIGDLDDDQDLDVVVTSISGEYTARFINDGSGVFTHQTGCCGTLGNPGALDSSLADMNSDGILDLVTSHGFGFVGINFFDGDTGETQIYFDTNGERLTDLRLADFDSDGDLDIAVLNDEDHVQVLFNNGHGFIEKIESYFAGGSAVSLNLCDADQDDQVDLVVSSSLGTIVVMQNLHQSSGACLPDLNDDGTLNYFDLSAFLVAYFDNDPAVDFNNDGTLNFFDVSAFLVAYQEGCP